MKKEASIEICKTMVRDGRGMITNNNKSSIHRLLLVGALIINFASSAYHQDVALCCKNAHVVKSRYNTGTKMVPWQEPFKTKKVASLTGIDLLEFL